MREIQVIGLYKTVKWDMIQDHAYGAQESTK